MSHTLWEAICCTGAANFTQKYPSSALQTVIVYLTKCSEYSLMLTDISQILPVLTLNRS